MRSAGASIRKKCVPPSSAARTAAGTSAADFAVMRSSVKSTLSTRTSAAASASAGEFIALLGPNGAGKSTLFQLLSGLFVPNSGRIAIMGHDMLRDPVPALAMLGIVFQQPTLDLELTVTGNLLFHAGLHWIPRAVAKSRIEKELARLGLAERAHDKAGTLSGGNRRGLELARALLHEPRALLMDEATVGLDPGKPQRTLEADDKFARGALCRRSVGNAFVRRGAQRRPRDRAPSRQDPRRYHARGPRRCRWHGDDRPGFFGDDRAAVTPTSH